MTEPVTPASVQQVVAEAIHRSCTRGDVGPPDGLAITQARDALAALADWLERDAKDTRIHSLWDEAWLASRLQLIAELRGQAE